MSFFAKIGRLGKRSAMPEAQKASRTGPLVAMHRTGEPLWTPRNYAALAREGYNRNPIVYRCVRLIAESAASANWLLYEKGEERDEHPLLSLLARPNSHQAQVELLEAFYGHLLVSGNAYVEAVAVGGVIRELHILRPDRMKIIAGNDGWPQAYEYEVSGERVRFAIEGETNIPPILHMKFFHPLNDHYGFAPIEAASTSLDIHNAAANWNKALLDNAARPSGALIYQGQYGSNLSDEQFDRLKRELEDNYQGARNAGRPLLLEGGLDWRAMSLSPRDLDFIETKNQAAREIALAFGVPPMLLGIPGDNTYANYAEANRAFWRQTILPLAQRTAAAFATWLAPAYEGVLRFDIDLDAIMALAPEREAMWARLQAADFLSEDEKRSAVGYGPRNAATKSTAKDNL